MDLVVLSTIVAGPFQANSCFFDNSNLEFHLSNFVAIDYDHLYISK